MSLRDWLWLLDPYNPVEMLGNNSMETGIDEFFIVFLQVEGNKTLKIPLQIYILLHEALEAPEIKVPDVEEGVFLEDEGV